MASQIAFFAPFASENASILEIGCATGELAATTRPAIAPARYHAIELSPAGDQARRHVDRLHTQPLVELMAQGAIGEASFDLVLMSHVLEHLEDPGAEIDAIKRVLRPGGALFLEVPNRSGNRRLPIDDNRSHLQFFSPASLCRMLADRGMETLAAATDARLDARYADSLRVVAGPFATPTWGATLLSDHPSLRGEDEIVVWGAGSLAMEMLANFFDPSRIAFFIDRDPAKLGEVCLGRPVRAPDALGASPRTVLVNSIDFGPAIAADIAALYPGAAHRLVFVGDLLA
ncbi:MAG: methyltransferase domain-containing protein [Caulobacteraceae bacterium]